MGTYMVVSFDFGGTSAVKVHCVTKTEAVGRTVYAAVSDSVKASNTARGESEAGGVLVDLFHVPDGYSSVEGHTLFWGNDNAPKTILSNNTAA